MQGLLKRIKVLIIWLVVVGIVHGIPLGAESEDVDSGGHKSWGSDTGDIKAVDQNCTFVNSSLTEMSGREFADGKGKADHSLRKRGLWSCLFGDPVDKKKEIFIGYLATCSNSPDDGQERLYRGMLGNLRLYTTDDLKTAKLKAREACVQASMPGEKSTPKICLISIKAYKLWQLRKAYVPSNVPHNCCSTMQLHYVEDHIELLEAWLFKGSPPAPRDVVRFSKVWEPRQGNTSVPFHAAWHWKQMKYMTEKCYPADDVIDFGDEISYQKLLLSSSDPNSQVYPYWGRVAGAKYVNVYPPPYASWGLTW